MTYIFEGATRFDDVLRSVSRDLAVSSPRYRRLLRIFFHFLSLSLSPPPTILSFIILDFVFSVIISKHIGDTFRIPEKQLQKKSTMGY